MYRKQEKLRPGFFPTYLYLVHCPFPIPGRFPVNIVDQRNKRMNE